MNPTLLCSGPELGPVPGLPSSVPVPPNGGRGIAAYCGRIRRTVPASDFYPQIHTPLQAVCPVLNWFRISPMAVRAGLGRGLLKENRFAIYLFFKGMAHRAAHILVGPRQRELGALVMVKGRRGPMLVHVAVGALRYARFISLFRLFDCKLGSVRVDVAGFALLRRSLELNLVGPRQCLVALAAGDPAMSPQQRELCFRMVEALNVDPRPGVVAGFAAERRAVGALGRHAFLEFAFVHVLVAGVAIHVGEMERENFVGSAGEPHLVALGAADGHVSSRERILGVFVLGDSECRAMEILDRVAILAAILVRRRGEL